MSITVSQNSVKYKDTSSNWVGLNNVLDGVKELPSVTTDDNGKILQVVSGNWEMSSDYLPLSGGYLSGQVNVKLTTSNEAAFGVYNSLRSGKFTVTSAGYLGIYDLTNDQWMISSDSSGVVSTTGDFKSGGAITASGEIISTNSNGFRLAYGSYGMILRTDGSAFYMLPTASGDSYGSWSSNRPLIYNYASNSLSMFGVKISSAGAISTSNHIAASGYFIGTYDGTAYMYHSNNDGNIYFRYNNGGTTSYTNLAAIANGVARANSCGTFQIVGFTSVNFIYSGHTANTVSPLQEASFTAMPGAQGYFAVPIQTGWNAFCGVGISRTTVQCYFVNTSERTHTSTGTVLVFGYKWI